MQIRSFVFSFIHSFIGPLTSESTLITTIISLTQLASLIVQELCESRGGRPGLSVLTSLLVSVDVKIY